jgi:hypothetical protein
MQIIHTEPCESEEAAEIVRGLGWLLHSDQLEAGSFAGMCDTTLGAGAQFLRRQFNRTVCVHGEVPVGMIALGIVGSGVCRFHIGNSGITCRRCTLRRAERSSYSDCMLCRRCICRQANTFLHVTEEWSLMFQGRSRSRVCSQFPITLQP